MNINQTSDAGGQKSDAIGTQEQPPQPSMLPVQFPPSAIEVTPVAVPVRYLNLFQAAQLRERALKAGDLRIANWVTHTMQRITGWDYFPENRKS